MNTTWLNWLFDELTHIQQFPRLAVGLVVLAVAVAWYLAYFLSRTQISNLQSEVALLKSQLATADGPRLVLFPCTPLGALTF